MLKYKKKFWKPQFPFNREYKEVFILIILKHFIITS